LPDRRHYCWGGTEYPTYNYYGCSVRVDYGVGWSAYQVWTQWHYCFAYIPYLGICGWNAYPITEVTWYTNGGWYMNQYSG
jgi:hypothetical protein